MGISKRICHENKVEMGQLKIQTKRILEMNEKYPGQLNMQRRMNLTIRLNEIAERVEYLRRDKHANIREEPDKNFEFQYVLKKSRVKNRKG